MTKAETPTIAAMSISVENCFLSEIVEVEFFNDPSSDVVLLKQ